jgi:UDP-N-acetylmuramate dehydrogenase
MGSQSQPIAYAELAKSLGVSVDSRAPLDVVRQAVLDLRASKGMVLNDSDHDSWSVGSFFLNPIVDADQSLPDGAITYPQPDGSLKVSAAWLIVAAGIERGFALPGSKASVSTKHTLALTNRGGATTDDVLELARTIRERVFSNFQITLVAEPNFLGCSL